MQSINLLLLLSLVGLVSAKAGAVPRGGESNHLISKRMYSQMSSKRTTPSSHSFTKRATSNTTVISPKVMVIGMFTPESAGFKTGLNLTVPYYPPGISLLYPTVMCNVAGEICSITLGEGQSNAASSAAALTLWSGFNLTQTYFMVAGIAGISPYMGTTGSVTFAKHAVDVTLAYEVDARELPASFDNTTGYFAFDTTGPNQYPLEFYGDEVFSLNGNFVDVAFNLTKGLTLNDSTAAAAFRSNYSYAPANQKPSVVVCATATSDTYWSGALIAGYVQNITALLTNSTEQYCTTQQEDNSTLESLWRANARGAIDFSRVLVMRSGSDFDRPPPGKNISAVAMLTTVAQGGFTPSIENLFVVGSVVINEITGNWLTWQSGVPGGGNNTIVPPK